MPETPQTTLPPVPREPIINGSGQMSMQWTRWIQQIQRILSYAGGVSWGIVNKGGSLLSDIETRYHSMLQRVFGADVTNTEQVIEDEDHVKHVSDEQAQGWETARYDASAALALHGMATKRNERGDTQALNWMGQ